jgi:hypothetical protein
VKIKYTGISAVDIDGHDNVAPGDVVDVPTELADRLLDNGQWSKTGKPTIDPADAGKES